MSHEKLADRLQRTIDGRCSSLAEEAERGVTEYDGRCEAQLVALAREMEERLAAHRNELEELYARRVAHERVNAQRRRESQLAEEALASIRERIDQLPTADPARYRRYLLGLLEKLLADREGPMVILAAERDLEIVQKACAELEEVEAQLDSTLQSGLRARETATGGFVDASLLATYERSRAALASQLVRTVFGGGSLAPGGADHG